MKVQKRIQPHIIYLDEIIIPISDKLGYSDNTEYILNRVKSLLRAISRRLAFPKAVQFFSNLPLPLQALQVEQWQIDQYLPEPLADMDDLLSEIVRTDEGLPEDKHGKEIAKSTLLTMIAVASVHISTNEARRMISVFPEDIQERMLVHCLPNDIKL